jgi:hypothetical protein
MITAALSTPYAATPVMKRREPKSFIIKTSEDEEKISKRMFAEYREENAKDLEREGRNW